MLTRHEWQSFSSCPPSASLSPFSANQIVFRLKSCFVSTRFAGLFKLPENLPLITLRKKVNDFPVPSWDVTYQALTGWE
jgi:hypothetical protein